MLTIEDLSQSFGGVQAVNGVSLSVPEGAFYGLIGPNGAGKTTLIECASGVIRSFKGKVTFGGQDITGWPLHRVAGLGLVRTFQASRVFSRMSVLSNLMAGPPKQRGERFLDACLGLWRKEQGVFLGQARALAREFELTDVTQNYGSELSGGQRRLTELTRALMARPRMLLLDEPFAGVSPTNRARLAQQLNALCRDQGLSILMVEHRLELVEQLCDHIIVMAEGRVLAQGPMDELRRNSAVISAYLGEVVVDGA
ncbi:MAG TPA: ABC transporter ATP-binding protein [Chloroflexota bacterium]|nr:ABC transporter ATP-binding protein [Chloroflexota bacterium]